MKKIAALCIAATLALTATTSAQADWGRHHGGHRHHGHHHSGGSWVGPAAVLAITGLAIGAAMASQNYYAPAPVYNAPPRPMPQVGYDTWYYCGSSGQYYPYTDACPEGWQAVPAR
jgi:hypothetical protein